MKLVKYKWILIATLAVSFLFSPGAFADTINQQTTFNVNSTFDKYSRTTLNATLRHIGSKAYFYIDDNYWNSLGTPSRNSLLANIDNLADDFDNIIHPQETSYWGSEPNPGIDGDSRLTILLEELANSNGGYFETGNGYTKAQVADSNQREMLSLNVEVTAEDINVTKMFLAHEFQHLISFNQKEKMFSLSEDIWLNELRSEYAISVAGYNNNYTNSNLERRARLFATNPPNSLTEWPNENTDYAMVALFAEYLAEQFGPDILPGTLRSPYVGINSLNQYFQSRGYYERFNDVFMSWLGALYLNDVGQSSKLGYQRPELRGLKASPQQTVFLSSGLKEYSSTQYVKDWQPLWLEYDVSAFSSDLTQSVKIELSGESGQNYLGSYLALYDGRAEFGKINISSGRGTGYVLNPDKTLRKVILLATKSTKTSNFGTDELPNYLNVKLSMVQAQEAQAGTLREGALIKKPVEKEIYVIRADKYKRYLLPGVIAMYGHLNPANAIEVGTDIFYSYTTTNYVRYVNDPKVYAVWPDGTKHWLNITAQQWDASGRDWNAIFIINELELNYYRTGADITR